MFNHNSNPHNISAYEQITYGDDAQLAAHLAYNAGRILLEVRKSKLFSRQNLGKIGDAISNQFLTNAIAHHRPDDGLLSEESEDDKSRLNKERVWIIDPVDGTREYGEGRMDWAVHVGLSINGHAKIGAVALPAADMVLRSDKPLSPPIRADQARMLVSRSRPAKEALRVAQSLNAKLIEMGSAGAKAMAVVKGEADIYLHSGGQYAWDNCAPVAVALAHALHCSRIDGSPLLYNEANNYIPDLLICHKADARHILNLIKKAGIKPLSEGKSK